MQTFINTKEMESYIVVDAYIEIGSGIDEIGPLKNLKARINVNNLLDTDTCHSLLEQLTVTAFYRPLSPRTFQISFGADF